MLPLGRGMLAAMEPRLREALAAIDAAEAEVQRAPPFEITAQHARDIAAVMALPENRDGADKSSVWRRFVAVRRHFQNVRPV